MRLWAAGYILASLAITAWLFIGLTPSLKPQIFWEAGFYWCMMFVPPMIIADIIFWTHKRRLRLKRISTGTR